jgi:hypothetical protein
LMGNANLAFKKIEDKITELSLLTS